MKKHSLFLAFSLGLLIIIFSTGLSNAAEVNIAPLAVVTASSEDPFSVGQLAIKAVDGIVDGYFPGTPPTGDVTKEWSSVGGLDGGIDEWLNLSWSTPYYVNRVVLHDRVSPHEHITSATLTFSDGPSQGVGTLNNDGTATEVTLDNPRVITSMRMTVNTVSLITENVGLAEIEVWGTHKPVANAGPDNTALVTNLVTLDGSLSSDVDGDPLTYAWSITSKPALSAAVLSDATVVNPTFTADKPGSYVLQLIVNDGTVDSAPDTVTITVPGCVGVAPASAAQEATLEVTITGSNTNFEDGLTAVSFMCAGTTSYIKVNLPTPIVTSSTEVKANITIASNAPLGACDVIATTNLETITCTGAFTINAAPVTTTTTTSGGGNGGGGGGGSTTTTSTPVVVTTTTTSPAVTTSTTTSIPPQCAVDADCDDDGVFCNGAEKCVDGTCTKGQSPCGDEQLCKETLKQCWDVTSITGRSLNPNVFRPIIRAQKCLWIVIFTSRDSQFNRDTSTIEITGAEAGAQGVSLNTKRNAFKFAGFIFVPVCVERGATTGQWNITIKTDIEETSTEETIVTSFQVR